MVESDLKKLKKCIDNDRAYVDFKLETFAALIDSLQVALKPLMIIIQQERPTP